RRTQIETEFGRLIRTSADIQKGCFDRSVDDKTQFVVSTDSQAIGKIMASCIGLDRLYKISIYPLNSDLGAFSRMPAGIFHSSLKSACPSQCARHPQQ